MSHNLSQMWRRMYLRIQDLIDQQINDTLGAITSGGKVPATIVSGSSPVNGIGMLTATGDLLSFQSGAYVRIPIGFAGQVLTVIGGMPTWANGPIIIGVGLVDDGSVDLVDDSGVPLLTD